MSTIRITPNNRDLAMQTVTFNDVDENSVSISDGGKLLHFEQGGYRSTVVLENVLFFSEVAE